MIGQKFTLIDSMILENNFKLPQDGVQSKRSFIAKSDRNSVINTVAGGMIYFYQNIISEQIQASCSYEITCSQYLKLCIEKYGFVIGTFAGINQFGKCAGNNHKNHSSYKLNEKNIIINKINEENYK
jgi:putative component of membrane protein insertase Oxa1/YidC/SpoIIIJ protein YidD